MPLLNLFTICNLAICKYFGFIFFAKNKCKISHLKHIYKCVCQRVNVAGVTGKAPYKFTPFKPLSPSVSADCLHAVVSVWSGLGPASPARWDSMRDWSLIHCLQALAENPTEAAVYRIVNQANIQHYQNTKTPKTRGFQTFPLHMPPKQH